MRIGRWVARVITGFQAMLAASAGAADSGPTLIPAPALLVPGNGHFTLNSRTPLRSSGPGVEAPAAFLADLLRHHTGLPLAEGDGPPIEIEIQQMEGGNVEAYDLHVTPQRLYVRSATPTGILRAAQTLRQLAQPANAGDAAASEWRIAALKISDRPRFPWRGSLLDCGRHFMPVEFVRRYIDLLAYHKMNVLHWHLTEDQGWRIEIRKHPRLTEVGAWRSATRDSEQPRDERGRYGGFYTQAQIREVVAYAAERGVQIVPEIEMPGHALAALAAYPELSCTGGPFEVGTKWGVYDDVFCAGNDQVFALLEDVLSEVTELFPGKFVHIGGDECPKTRWKACAKCQARIRREGLADEHELQSYFIRRIATFLAARNKRLIGWDEILEGGLAPDATVQSWRGFDGAIAAARAGHDVISSPTSHCYIDYAQGPRPDEPLFMGYIPLERAYAFEPVPAALTADEARHVLGLEANLWTEHAPPKLVDRQAFPRLAALAEVAWSPAAMRDWTDFRRRLAAHDSRLRALGVTPYEMPTAAQPAPRDEPDWHERHKLLLERCAQPRVDVVFIGDSITQGWEAEGKLVWARDFEPLNAINLGIGGDRTQHVLWRLENGALDRLTAARPDGGAPRLVVLLIGTNNSNGDDHSAFDIAAGIRAIVLKLRERLPQTRILLLSILPRNERPDEQRAKCEEASRLAAQLADGRMVHALDVGPQMLAADGTLPRDIMPDLLHLSRRGYEIWGQALLPRMQELLAAP